MHRCWRASILLQVKQRRLGCVHVVAVCTNVHRNVPSITLAVNHCVHKSSSYTGCFIGIVLYLRRTFIRLNYIETTKNTCALSLTVMEIIMERGIFMNGL